jgi:hypothetical protein
MVKNELKRASKEATAVLFKPIACILSTGTEEIYKTWAEFEFTTPPTQMARFTA